MTKKSKGHRVYGGQGSHWVGCEESHWDCLLRKECPGLYDLILGKPNILEVPNVHDVILEVRKLLRLAYP